MFAQWTGGRVIEVHRMNRPRELPLSGSQSLILTARALLALTKPRIAFASVLTALAGYAAASKACGVTGCLTVLAASGLAAGGVLAFNQWWERDTDPLMARTRHRPLVCGVIPPGLALGWSVLLSVSGVVWLAASFNASAAAVAAAIIVIYGFVYTPMKRTTRWATEVGSVSGALPPLLGSAAAGDFWSVPAWILAAVLLFWQMPHSFAIGWIHRADYRAAGMPLLPAVDVSVTATLTAAVLLAMAWRFFKASGSREREARLLFRATLITLPLLMLAMVFDQG
jgi:protoheme IX farnesyltransferase